MAYFKQYKLLPFKLTQHHGATSTTKVLHRGEETSNEIVPDLSGSRSSEAQFAQICLFGSTPAEFRCKARGPFTFYCCNCLKVYHQNDKFLSCCREMGGKYFI